MCVPDCWQGGQFDDSIDLLSSFEMKVKEISCDFMVEKSGKKERKGKEEIKVVMKISIS